MKCYPKTISILMFHSRLLKSSTAFSIVPVFQGRAIQSLCTVLWQQWCNIFLGWFAIQVRLTVEYCSLCHYNRGGFDDEYFTDEFSKLSLNRTEPLMLLNSDIVAYSASTQWMFLSYSFNIFSFHRIVQQAATVSKHTSLTERWISSHSPSRSSTHMCQSTQNNNENKNRSKHAKVVYERCKKKKKNVTIEVKIT